jgi:hypothetical protein
MRSDSFTYHSINGRDVWIDVEAPMVKIDEEGHVGPDKYLAAFRIEGGPPPSEVIVGHVRDGAGKLRWFDQPGEAYQAGLEEARRRPHHG